jgi:hypothetical protein
MVRAIGGASLTVVMSSGIFGQLVLADRFKLAFHRETRAAPWALSGTYDIKSTYTPGVKSNRETNPDEKPCGY